MKLKTLKITAALLACTMFLPACGKKDDAANTDTNKTAQEETVKNDYHKFMIKVSEDFVKEKFGASEVKVEEKDYAAIHNDEVLKSLDGKSYDKSILGSGIINIDGKEFKYQIIVDVDSLENPKDYTVLNFETINQESQYFYNNLED